MYVGKVVKNSRIRRLDKRGEVGMHLTMGRVADSSGQLTADVGGWIPGSTSSFVEKARFAIALASHLVAL